VRPSAVHGEGEARRERLHPAPERGGAVRFDDQVRVIVLDRVVDEPEVLARAGAAKRRLDLAHDRRQTERRQARAHLQRDVAGMLGEKRLSPTVEHDRARPTRTPAAMPIEALPAEVEHALLRPSHHGVS
jgi:hypothetical protein